MLFVGGGGQGQVFAGFDAEVFGGADGAGDHGDVAAGVDGEVTAHVHVRAILQGGLLGAFDAAALVGVVVLFGLAGDDHVAPGGHAGVATGLEVAADVEHIAPGVELEGVGGFEARGVAGHVVAQLVAFALLLEGGDGALVENVAGHSGGADVAGVDDAATGVADRVGGEHFQAVAGLHQAAVVDVAGDHAEVVGGAQGAAVVQVAAGDQAHVLALDQCAVGCQAVVGLGQVEHWGEDFLAIDLGFFHPHDVVGQRRDLFGSQRHAELQLERVLVADGVVHQVTEQRVVTGDAIDVALAGAGHHGFADQALLIETIAQAFPGGIRVVAQFAQQVIGAHELLEVGERRVGFDQVFVAVVDRSDLRQPLHAGYRRRAAVQVQRALASDRAAERLAIDAETTLLHGAVVQRFFAVFVGNLAAADAEVAIARGGAAGAVCLGLLAAQTEQAILAGGQAEAGQGGRVDLALCQVWRQLRGNRRFHRGGEHVGVGVVVLRRGLDVGGVGANHAVVDFFCVALTVTEPAA